MANRRQNAVAYMRVPPRLVRSQRADFARQRYSIYGYARTQGFEILGEFTDVCISSGAGLKHRQGLAALLDYVEHNWVEVVLVDRADRLAGDLIVSEVILGQFRERDVRVIAADSGLELTSSDCDVSRKLIREALSVVTKFEKSVLVLKLKAARERVRRQKGRCEGRKPFGYYAHEQETLKRILILHRKPRGEKRLGYYRIATILNEEGHQTRSGRPWIGPTVRGIVQRCKRRSTKKA